MDRIGDTCIYVGDRDAAESLQRYNGAEITHILTIDNYPLKWIEENGSYKYLYCQCLDMETEDLLSHFQSMFKFIDEVSETQNGKILIHCFAGMSRSVTVAVGYLMYKSKIPLDAALHIVKQYRGRVKPNPGFMRQLELFEQMGCTIDANNTVYRQYKLEVMAQNVQAGSLEVKETDLAEDVGSNKTENYYRCMKCRRALFRTSSLLPHTAGQGEAAFDWRSKIPANKRPVCDSIEKHGDTVCDRSLFIEPVQWMAGFINQLDGKMMCPKCDSKLGSFIWYGERCPCGTWVAPAFHIQSSKVDLMKPRLPVVMKQSQISTAALTENFTFSGASDNIQSDIKSPT
ncbi:probable dual specificity protein phosphatase DDB_G0281963 [Mercenaria mercenaria]|uniref:probable dual specificity protein phosphatase DDB_G0281963 n=1 Tax=Mercenaria mercenaria TaxID=6596 RepID=UPI00234F4628|nr:probable dual specificity protein phosphatase DDB_G0281963 [Mercenaria mercenaria]XP_045199578.2 probable dual specificity protein phosphatase DDB_G0281963 [Mercenaria mercenaria]XP_045199588.2 probable dual specificity protein phosphatase DDB_G0281963 [Mercenaria mercenaria]XP_045199595.2 probable dual specificity protein phosphatase DDB_G0281963 [Mercenaria mercenaria]XP_053381209.1 probable dual specificity protein phosphatase DDB_G0281963 [Mercenaria mercenaria]